jgi:hypothetical protein
VKVTETYVYSIEMVANSKTEALSKVKNEYENLQFDGEFDGVFCADATAFEKVTFKVTE